MNIEKNKIIFLILAGGLSKRFGGGIKTFAKINKITIFEKILINLKSQSDKIIINANNETDIFAKSNFPIINDINSNFEGPLAGIYSSMIWIKKNKLDFNWILSVPSDTPFLPLNLLEKFKSKIKKNKKILIARYQKKIHPVIGLWNISLCKSLENEFETDNRKIMRWVYKNDFDFVDFPEQSYDPFFNINNKKDIFEAKKIEKIISELR